MWRQVVRRLGAGGPSRQRWMVASVLMAVTACGDVAERVESWATEVWVCHVPVATSSAWYAGLPERRRIEAAQLAERVAARVPQYFDEVSRGRLALDVTLGGELLLDSEDGAEECVQRVVERVASTTRLAVVVADAEHSSGQPGGLGGELTRDASAPVGSRGVGYAYVGAADFAPSWGDDPPMDLIEHEIGHALGWTHSGTTDDAYDSALDVMSDSAAPRVVDPSRRDAPWPLAAHLMASGWIEPGGWLVVEPVVGGSTSTTLVPLSSGHGRRLVVLPLPGRVDAVLTVESRESNGMDRHLPSSGLAVHRVEFDVDVTAVTGGGSSGGSALDWTAISRIVPLTGPAPFTQLVRPGESLRSDGWAITADTAGVVTVGLVSAP